MDQQMDAQVQKGIDGVPPEKGPVEGTNNAAERAIRPVVVAHKVSGGTRTTNGADAFAKLASLLPTAG
jgi:hypothetical protein